MKKLHLLFLCALAAAAASAQNIMVVEQNDNTVTEFKVDDIKGVYFKNNGGNTPNPSNSVLSSRLKDKDGKPVLLEEIRRLDGGLTVKYTYDENGCLRSTSNGADTYNFDGLTITSTHIGSHETRTIEMKVTLNEDGLISKIVEVDHIIWTKTSTLTVDFYFEYDSEKQLTGFKYDQMEYIDDGTQKEKHREYSTTWTNGNIGNGSYSNDFNICRQNLMNSCKETGGPFVEVEDLVFGHLYLIGLFGIGPKNFPSKVEYTLNANGTVATESSHSFIYK